MKCSFPFEASYSSVTKENGVVVTTFKTGIYSSIVSEVSYLLEDHGFKVLQEELVGRKPRVQVSPGS